MVSLLNNVQKKSKLNKGNRSLKRTAYTTGSIFMAKCRKDLVKFLMSFQHLKTTKMHTYV